MIKNLTPHPLKVRLANGEFREFPKCENPLRISTKTSQIRLVEGIPLFATEMGAPENVPPVESGVYYVVSRLAASHENLRHRQDLLCPGPLVRDEKGQVIGCEGFSLP